MHSNLMVDSFIANARVEEYVISPPSISRIDFPPASALQYGYYLLVCPQVLHKPSPKLHVRG